MRRSIIILFFLLAFPLATTVSADDSRLLAPVRIFFKFYGTDQMGLVAEVVTDDFRRGKAKDEWAADTGSLLQSLEYKRLKNEIKKILVEDGVGVVQVRAKVDTVAGSAVQDELYRMVRIDGVWKIDALEVFNDVVDPKTVTL